jgi:hypothetical protein
MDSREQLGGFGGEPAGVVPDDSLRHWVGRGGKPVLDFVRGQRGVVEFAVIVDPLVLAVSPGLEKRGVKGGGVAEGPSALPP